METLPRFEGSQNQAFCLPPSNSASQNGNGFQGVTTGGWFNGNLSDKVSGGQPTMATNLSTHTCPQYFTHNGQTANGNYWKNQAMGSNSVRNSYPFSSQRNGNGIGEAVPQMPLRNQALMNGNGNCIVSSGKHAPTFQYPAGQTLWRADVPKGYQGQDLPSVTNTANPQMMADNRNYYNSQEVFPRVSNGAWAATSQGQRNHNIYQHYLQRMMCGGQGTSPVNPLRQKLNPHYFQGTAVTGQGVVNSENGAMNKNQREGVNGPAVVGFPHAGDRTIMRQGMTSRRNGTGASPVCGNLAPVIQNANPSHFQGAMNRSQGPAVSSPTTTVRHFPGQSAHSHTQVVLPRDVTDDTLERILWALVLKSQTDPTQRNENGGGNVTTAPERTAELQLGSSAPTGDLRSTLNLPCPRGSGNQNINQLGHFGAGLQNVTQQQPVCHLPSSGATANVVADPSCTGKQGSLRLPAGQPPPRRAQNPVRRNAQGTGYRMQSHNGSAQPPSFPGTLNGCVAKGVGHTGSPTMVTHTAKQLPVSVVDNRNGNCARASNASNGHSSSSPNQGGQLCVKQPAADTPPYPKRHGYFVTVTEDRLGKGFTAENVIFVGNQPADNVSTLQGCQIPPAEKTVNLDCGGTIGELSGNGSPDKHDTNLSASVTSAESMFNQPKASNQQNKSACSSSQRAVVVVPPISQQSSNSADQWTDMANADDRSLLKTPSLWCLTEEDAALQHKIHKPTSVLSPADKGSDGSILRELLSTSTSAVSSDSEPLTDRASSGLEKTSQISDSVGSTVSSSLCVSDLMKKDACTSNPLDPQPRTTLVTSQVEEVPSLNAHESVPQPSVDVGAAQDVGLEKNRFDLSSVPVIKWTTAELRNFVSLLEETEKPPELEIDIKKTLRLFWGGNQQNFLDSLRSDHYRSIMFDAFRVCTQDAQSVVFSQIEPACLQKVENCQIIKHDTTFPDEVVYKSSWLNLNEQLDDIDKEHGFPFHLQFGRCILEEEEEESKGKEVNECDDKPGEAASESQAEKEGPAPTGVEMDTPIDPLSALEINVLPPEDAVRFFRGDVSTDAKAEDLQREGGEPASEVTGSQMEVELPAQRVQKKKRQLEVYCCVSRWIDVVTGNKTGSGCSCSSKATSNQETVEGSASSTDTVKDINVVPEDGVIGGDRSALKSNTTLMQTVEVVTPGEKVKALSDECAKTENGSVVSSVQDPMNGNEGRDAIFPLQQNAKEGVKGSFRRLGDESISELAAPPAPARRASNVVEVEIEDVCSSYEDVLKMATVTPEPLWRVSRCKRQGSLCSNKDESRGTGSKVGGVPSVCDKAVPRSGSSSKWSEPPHFTEDRDVVSIISLSPETGCYSSEGKYNRSENNVKRGGKKLRKVHWEETPESKSPIQDHSPQSLMGRKGNDKSLPEAQREIKVATDDTDNSKMYLKEKRKAVLQLESPPSKLQKLVKHSEKVQSNKGGNGQQTEGRLCEALPEPVKENCHVSLVLYGSSPQRRLGTLGSNRHLERKPNKTNKRLPYGDKTLSPPATITFNVSFKTMDASETCHGNSTAKQQVFANWKSSLVTAKNCSARKSRLSKLHITEGQRKTFKGQETARSPQSKIVPGKLPARTTCLNKNENQKSTVTKSPENKSVIENKSTQTQQQTEESVTGRSKNGKRHDTAALSSSPEEDASVKREKGAEPARRQSRRLFAVGKPDAGRRSRHDAGNPAVIPSQKENCVLDFKLLPESFSFKDDRDLQGPAKRRNPVKIEPVCPKVSDKQPESLKKTSWGAQGSWSKHSGSKRPTSSKTMSSRETTSSTFQEYKKKYMAQGKK